MQVRIIRKQQPEMITARIKEDYNTIKLFLLTGQIVGVRQTTFWRKSQGGFPSYLYPITLLNLTDLEKCLILTQLRLYKKLPIPAIIDITTIVQPLRLKAILWSHIYGYRLVKTGIKGTGMVNVWQLAQKLNLLDKKLSIKSLTEIYSPGLQTGSVYSASGPQGSTFFAKLHDLVIIRDHKVYLKILSIFRTTLQSLLIQNKFSLSISHGINTPEKLIKWLFSSDKSHKVVERLYRTISKSREVINFSSLGKLSYFLDGAGKLRYIAVGNRVIQITLYPLHMLIIKYIKFLLKGTDATYNQQVIFEKFQKNVETRIKDFCKLNNLQYPLPLDFDFDTWYCENFIVIPKFKAPYSLDLSRATDRIPLLFQSYVLRTFTNSWVLAITWYLIISIFRLTIKYPSGNKRQVYYAAGQGMGLYSSWAILALTHHLIVKIRALQIGIRNFSDYLVLGDDIVIFREEVASQYIKVITNLGVEISTTKTVTPELYWGAEFASKLVYENEQGQIVDLSPLPLGPILEGGISSLFKIYGSIFEKILSDNEDPHQNALLLGQLPGKLYKYNLNWELLVTLWSICILYQKWYKADWSSNGTIVAPPKGVTLDRTLQYLVRNYLTVIPLQVFVVIDKMEYNLLVSQISRMTSKVLKYSYDYSPLQESICKSIPRTMTEVRSNLKAWEELFLFYQSPFYSVQTIIEDRLIRITPVDGNISPFTLLKVFITDKSDEEIKQIVSSLDPQFMEIFINILQLSWGPGGYLQQKVKSMDPFSTRVSKGKRNIVLKDIIIFKACKSSIHQLVNQIRSKSRKRFKPKSGPNRVV